jgi:sugar phosphate isomerase/epimerase
MKLGATAGLFSCFGEERYKKMKEYGFDYADYGISGDLGSRTEEEYEALILAEKALADEAGVTIHQVHGHWRYPPHDETKELRDQRAEWMRRAIRLTAKIGCKNWVVHVMMPFGPNDAGFDDEAFLKINLDFFRELLPCAKENGVTICLENMPMKQLTYSTTAKTLEIIHMIDDENFKLCLDTGHEAIFGNVGDAVRLAVKDLGVFHIHDNSGKRDDHWFPGMGVVDWKDFMAAVKEIEFDGVLSLEVAGNQAFFPSASNDARMKVLTALFGEIVNG